MSKSAAQENPDALALLSQMYAEGIGVPVDAQQAELWFIAALVQSPNDLQLNKQFDQRVKEKKESGGNADEFLKKCAEAGYVPASAVLADEFYVNGKYEEALPLLKKMSDGGDTASTLRLAKMNAEGRGGLPQDPAQARVLYRKAAEKGDATAQVDLAVMLEQGVGGAADPVLAESWYKRAAAQGNTAAQNRLAEIESARFPYVLKPIKELYPKSRARQKILLVGKNSKEYQSVSGGKVPGLSVSYERPSTSRMAGFSGIVLVGVELANPNTGDRYWFLGTYLDDGPTYDYSCNSDLDLFVAQDIDPEVAITGWAVVYGHLLPDRRTVAVLDTREFKTKSLEELLERNRFTTALPHQIVAKTLPQLNMGGDLADLETAAENSEDGFDWWNPLDWLDWLYPLN
jgi:hypothetical protein